MMNRAHQINHLLFRLTSVLPLGWMLTLYLFTFAGTIQLGHFPVPSLNDPKNLELDVLYHIVFFGFVVTFFGIFLWIAGFLASVFCFGHSLKRYTMVFIAGLSLMLIQIFIDPFQIIYWYLD